MRSASTLTEEAKKQGLCQEQSALFCAASRSEPWFEDHPLT
jgi:hypothetical protein